MCLVRRAKFVFTHLRNAMAQREEVRLIDAKEEGW